MSGTGLGLKVISGYLDAVTGQFVAYGASGNAGSLFTIGGAGQANAGLAVTAVMNAALQMTGSGTTFIFQNTGTKTCFVNIGGAGVTVTAVANGAVGGGFPIAPGAIMAVSGAGAGGTYVVAICGAGDSTQLFISQGSGN